MVERLQDTVTLQAERRPEAIAVVQGSGRLTYGELERASNQLAWMLKERGAGKGERIGLLLPKSPAAIVAILGVLKADGVYVPFDPSGPASRLAKIIESCDNRFILAAGSVAPLLDDLLSQDRFRSSRIIGWLGEERVSARHFKPEFSLSDLNHYPTRSRQYQGTRRDPAYILFTSGTTGTPKGVVITHSNVIHFVEWARDYFGMDFSDRVSGHSPLHFDLSVFDLFGALAAGAQLHLVPPELNVLPNQLARFIRTSQLTQWFSVPSILSYMAKFDVVKHNDFPMLRRLLWCGEVFPTPALIYWMKRLPHVRFTNLYGPTEATIASSYYTLPGCPEDERAAIPIGTACPGEELLVLDERLRPVPRGEAGDLYIRGVGLSPGYWREPEKTRSVFLPNPHSPDPLDRIYKTGDLAKIGEDGLIYFLGRADSQIKSRGYRIELGEIEAALNALEDLRECAVVAVPTDGFEGTVIGCAYVPFPDRPTSSMILRKKLSRQLPNYMLPTRWMALESLPKNANGKIDRRRLKESFQEEEFQRNEAQAH
jgi:amino acid adenylation domain-containing protein